MPDCRICLETGNALINPCSCKGSAEYVHTSCLEKWRGLDKDLKKHTYCDVCNSKYNTNLVFCIESIPDYNNSATIKFFINPFFVSGATYVLFLFILLCTGGKDEVELKRLFLTLEYFITGSYFGLYINLFSVVNKKYRYLIHINKSLILLPVSHIFVLSFSNSYPVPASILNHIILSQYLFSHIRILNSMNQEYVRIVEGANI
jgi:hypothetical protein